MFDASAFARIGILPQILHHSQVKEQGSPLLLEEGIYTNIVLAEI